MNWKPLGLLFFAFVFISCTSPIVFDPSKDDILEIGEYIEKHGCIRNPCLGKQSPRPEKGDLPKELQISGNYSFINGQSAFVFDSPSEDIYCYKIFNDGRSDANFVPIRFRLYDKNDKPLTEGMPRVSNIDDVSDVFAHTYMPYHKDAVKIKAILVDNSGQDVKVLAERKFIPVDKIQNRRWFNGCHREEGFLIH